MGFWNVCFCGTAVKTVWTFSFNFFLFLPSFAPSGGPPPQANGTPGLDFDLQDIKLIRSPLPGEDAAGSKSQGRSKSSGGGFIWVRSQAELLAERRRQSDYSEDAVTLRSPGLTSGFQVRSCPAGCRSESYLSWLRPAGL